MTDTREVFDAGPRFDVKIGDIYYALVRDPAHVHPPVLHRHLGTDTTSRPPEQALRRFLDAVEGFSWFDASGTYIGRTSFGVGLAGRP